MNINYDEFKKQALIRSLGLDKYNYIRENLHKCDVSKNKEFQRTFNTFYRVRRDEEWRNKFYDYFEEKKNISNITFETIIKDIFLRTGNIEASFSSKLLSTINPDMPIWDQYVLKNLDLEVEGTDKIERLLNTIDVYNEIIRKENEMLKEQEIIDVVNEFKKEFKKYKLSDIKVLDYLLWSSRENDEEE